MKTVEGTSHGPSGELHPWGGVSEEQPEETWESKSTKNNKTTDKAQLLMK